MTPALDVGRVYRINSFPGHNHQADSMGEGNLILSFTLDNCKINFLSQNRLCSGKHDLDF